jgi:chemotaxis protein CheX
MNLPPMKAGKSFEPAMKPDSDIPHASLELAEILDLKAAAPLASSILAHRGSDLTIDSSHVRRLGGQCLQVLLSAKYTWSADEMSLEFVNPSPDFIEALEGFGFSAEKLMDQELSR